MTEHTHDYKGAPLAIVVWRDSNKIIGESWTDLDHLEGGRAQPIVSAGFVLSVTKNAITLSGSVASGMAEQPLMIPLENVCEIHWRSKPKIDPNRWEYFRPTSPRETGEKWKPKARKP